MSRHLFTSPPSKSMHFLIINAISLWLWCIYGISLHHVSLLGVSSFRQHMLDQFINDSKQQLNLVNQRSSLPSFIHEAAKYNKLNHNQSSHCLQDVSLDLFNHWRKSYSTVCSYQGTNIESFPIQNWERQKGQSSTAHLYQNIGLKYLNSEVEVSGGSCQNLNNITKEKDTDGNTTLAIIEAPIIRVKSFDPWNSYERFHAYLNVAMTMAMFNITNPQLVYICKKGVSADSVPHAEIEMYSSFSTLKPVIYASMDLSKSNGKNIFVRYMIDLIKFHSGISILVVKSKGLRGRGTPHHCKSELFQGIIKWMRHNLLDDKDQVFKEEEAATEADNGTIQIVWSSRQPYCCREGGKWYPKRQITDETTLVSQVRQTLGNKYNITIVDFASVGLSDSVRIASQSNIIVGVHGAGLVWSSFLKEHGGIVEMFGGDRGSGNRHYHNIASLADLHYRSLYMHMRGISKGLNWDSRSVNEIVKNIRSITFHEEPGVKDEA